ncbi:MAG: sigma-70 family RNA polymerase sigma factor [Lentisphaeria bacterium]|nr:sigma-70 family RNA polymerase sigma factor [Lentisphaeria bacterium]
MANAELDNQTAADEEEALRRAEEENELVRQAKKGDDEAFGELVRRYQGRLRAYTSQYVDNASDVFEIVQDAFLNTHKHLDRFETGRAFYPWLRTICHNLVLNYFRSRRSKRHITLQLVDDAIFERLDAGEGVRDDDASERKIETLRACIQRLAKSQQQLVKDRYHHRVAVKEIAASQGASAASISMRLRRIRDRLKTCMTERLRRT